ncbi:MAG TPA: FKBP-type peptidyl-prolyl cis-trans isomerase [Actinomycetota bacterium]|nr:FKBP-type peptidyl-prolyl cis-trans isomerase [Actinomycetota bacterium]
MKTTRTLILVVLLLLGAACGDDSSEAGGGGGSDTPLDGCETGAVVELDSGLEYEELECGDGDEVARGDLITVHYTGTLEDGTEFDSSRGGDPVSFALESGSLIEGWVEGIPGMKEGGRRRLTIPPELGYGEAGYPPDIPPDSTLIFDVEVVRIEEDPQS